MDVSWVNPEDLDLYIRPEPITPRWYFSCWGALRFNRERWKNGLFPYSNDPPDMGEFLRIMYKGFSPSFEKLPTLISHPEELVRTIVRYRLAKER